MKNLLKKEKILQFEDKMLILALVLQDGGTFGFLPLNIFQIIILILFVLLILQSIKKKTKFYLPKFALCLLLFIALITFTQKFDFDSVKSFIFFSIEFLYFINYIKQLNGNYLRIKKVLYTSAFILASYGLIQLIGHYTDIRFLYDITLYGFTTNGPLVGKNGLLRLHSLYSEPSHLSSIISAAIYLGIVDYKKGQYSNKYQTFIIILFGLFTISTMLYISVTIFLFVYFIFFQGEFSKKMKLIIPFVFVILFLIIINPEFITITFGKFLTLFSATSTSPSDASGFAIVSNIRIAWNKITDGYIFGTGIDSHRLYYFNYINNLYSDVRMYLNSADAASMFTRVLSEFGIFGFIGFIGLIIQKFYRSIKDKNMDLLFFVTLLFTQSLRSGNYVYLIFMIAFTVCLSYQNQEKEKSIIKNRLSLKSKKK